MPIAFSECVQILTHETLRKKGVFYDFYKPTKIPYKALFVTHFKKEKGGLGIIRFVTSVGYHGHCHTSRLVKFLAAVVLVLALAVEVVIATVVAAAVAAASAAAFSLLDTNVGCEIQKITLRGLI